MKPLEEVMTEINKGKKFPYLCERCLKGDNLKKKVLEKKITGPVSLSTHEGWAHNKKSRDKRQAAATNLGLSRVGSKRYRKVKDKKWPCQECHIHPPDPRNRSKRDGWKQPFDSEHALGVHRSKAHGVKGVYYGERMARLKQKQKKARAVNKQFEVEMVNGQRPLPLQTVRPVQAQVLQRAANFEHLEQFLRDCEIINGALAYAKQVTGD